MDKYIVEVEPKPFTEYNPNHEIINGHKCSNCFFNIGLHGVFEVELDNDVHVYRTSTIENIVDANFEMVVTTKNTIYTFKKLASID